MIQLKNRSIFLILAMVASHTANAQSFSEKAIPEPVNKTGFYAIDITPELSRRTAVNFSDLRIADEKEQVVAYIIRPKIPSFYSGSYKRMGIIKNELTDSGRSVIIIENDTQEKISAIALRIRNAAVSRTANISGSDNLQKWFAIAEDINLEKRFVTQDDRYIQTITFPPSSYRYFKIVIDNGRNNPLNIIEAGRYNELQYKSVNPYLPNPPVNFIQIDSSDHNSYIVVHQTAPYHIDKVTIKLSGPKFFEREANVVVNNNTSDFQISLDSTFGFYLPTFNNTGWVIKIYNGDNPPLHILDVITQQEAKQIVAFLEGGKKYHLLMKDSLATKPVYDLQHFKDSIPADIPTLKILSFEKNDIKNQNTSTVISQKWLWPLIIAVIIILAIFTLRLTCEVERKK